MKKVVYPSKYIKAYQDDYRYEWVKLNDEPIEIEYVEDEHDEEYDFQPSFWWNNQRYHLNDFIRAKNNPWVSTEFPDFIDAYEAEEYYHPLFIELVDDYAVNIWEEKEISSIDMSTEIDSSVGFLAKKAALKYMMDEYGMTKEEAKAKMKDMTDDEIRDYADVQTILIDKNPRKAYSY